MSTWQIVIRGDGPHHSEKEVDNDADKAAEAFVSDLVDKGHKITSAHLHFDGDTQLVSADLQAKMDVAAATASESIVK